MVLARRAALPAALLLVLLAGSLAGCTVFERRGTLAVSLTVANDGALNDFRVLNLSLDKVKLEARSLSPDPIPSQVQKLELVREARDAGTETLFKQEVRADTYNRITVTTPPGQTFQGILQDGTKVAVLVPNNALSAITAFDVPRGGTVDYLLTLRVDKVNLGVGQANYQVTVDPEASHPK